MNPIFPLILMAGLTQTPATPPSEPGVQPLREQASSCDTKGCPSLDQNLQPPTSCEYEYGIKTAFKCILLCHYPNSQWGTIVDSSNCK